MIIISYLKPYDGLKYMKLYNCLKLFNCMQINELKLIQK